MAKRKNLTGKTFEILTELRCISSPKYERTHHDVTEEQLQEWFPEHMAAIAEMRKQFGPKTSTFEINTLKRWYLYNKAERKMVKRCVYHDKHVIKPYAIFPGVKIKVVQTKTRYEGIRH